MNEHVLIWIELIDCLDWNSATIDDRFKKKRRFHLSLWHTSRLLFFLLQPNDFNLIRDNNSGKLLFSDSQVDDYEKWATLSRRDRYSKYAVRCLSNKRFIFSIKRNGRRFIMSLSCSSILIVQLYHYAYHDRCFWSASIGESHSFLIKIDDSLSLEAIGNRKKNS